MAATTAHIVVAHCTQQLAWLAAAVANLSSCGVTVQRVFVYSKCGATPSSSIPFEHETLENVGREAHSYVHHLLRRPAGRPSLTFFLTDS